MSKKARRLFVVFALSLILVVLTSCEIMEAKSDQVKHTEKLIQNVLDLIDNGANIEQINAAIEAVETYEESELTYLDEQQVDNQLDFLIARRKLRVNEAEKAIDSFLKKEVKYTREYESELDNISNIIDEVPIAYHDDIKNIDTYYQKCQEFATRRKECRVKCTCTVPKETCSYCGGRGKKLYSGYDDWGNKVYADSAVTCSMCGGKGYTSCCPKCEGAGYLNEYEE